MKLIPNPCKSICKLKDNVCIGCYRTKEEIAAWPKLSNEQRYAIVTQIKENIKRT
jgi:predicted Fe-S protein YdhL (DUF1289 family)